MKKPKKQGDWKGWVFSIMLFVILFQRVYFPTTKQYCNDFSDKCVCEEYRIQRVTGDGCIWTDNGCIKENKDCNQFRLKTQAELDIDDCNNNPREDSDCKCEEYNYKEIRKLIVTYYDVNTNYINKTYQYLNKCQELQENETKCTIPLFLTHNGVTYLDSLPISIYFLNETIQNNCFKSRPKTECEKGNPDWVEEKENKELYNCPTEIECDTTKIQLPKCHTDCKLENQTICREKTDVEKLMDKDCDKLNGLVILEENWIGALSPSGFDIKDIKQAWRQKGCKI